MYYTIMYLIYMLDDGMNPVGLFYMFFQIFELTLSMSVNWCAKGPLFTWTDLLKPSPDTFYTDVVTDKTDNDIFARLYSAAELEDYYMFEFGTVSNLVGIESDVAFTMFIIDFMK